MSQSRLSFTQLLLSVCIISLYQSKSAIILFQDDMSNFTTSASKWNIGNQATIPMNSTDCPSMDFNPCLELKKTGQITSNPISITNYNNIKLQYDLQVINLTGAESCIIQYSLNSNSTFTQIMEYQEPSRGTIFKNETFSIPNANSLTIRVLMNAGQGADKCYIDNVKITGEPTGTIIIHIIALQFLYIVCIKQRLRHPSHQVLQL